MVTNQIMERLAVRVYLSRLDSLTELRLVASDRLQFFLERGADVDYERRLLVVFPERKRMENLAGAVGRYFGLDLFQTGDEARVAYELRDDGMIGMSPMKRVSDYNLRLEPPAAAGPDIARPGSRRTRPGTAVPCARQSDAGVR